MERTKSGEQTGAHSRRIRLARQFVVDGVFIVLAIAVTVIGILAQESKRSPVASPALRDPAIEQALLKQGFPAKIAAAFASTSSTVKSSEGLRYHIVQDIPSLTLRRDFRVVIHADQSFDTSDMKPLMTAEGYDVYPLRFKLVSIPGGYQLYRTFFLPYDNIDPDTLKKLGIVKSVARFRPNVDVLTMTKVRFEGFRRLPQSGVLGMVVSSAVTVGNGDTFISPAVRPSSEAATEILPSAGSRWAVTPENMEFVQWLKGEWAGIVRRPPMTKKERDAAICEINADLRKKGWHIDQVTERRWQEFRSEIAIEGEKAAEQTARRQAQAEATRRAESRFMANAGGVALAVGQGVGQFVDQAADWWQNRNAIQSAQDCFKNPTNRLARTARSTDPMHKRVGEDLNEAESNNDGLAAARAVGTVADAVLSVVMPFEAGLFFSLTSAGNDAMMAETQRINVSNAVNSVTPCKPWYFSATVSYTYSNRNRGDSDYGGHIRVDTSRKIVILNGSTNGSVDSSFQIPKMKGWGDYRDTEVHATSYAGNDCKNVAKIEGPMPIILNGKFKEMLDEECPLGRKITVPVFTVTLNAEGSLLASPLEGNGLEEIPYVAESRCVPVPATRPKETSAKVVCYFPAVKLLEGGSFFSDFEQRDDLSDLFFGESRRCRLDIRILAAPQP